MGIWKAELTLQAIDEALVRDEGSVFKGNQRRVLPHIGDAYSEENDPYRTHLGASVIGSKCARAAFYGHRWVSRKAPKGKKGEPKTKAHARMIRLWNRGHLEEGRFISLLLMIGCRVYQQDEQGRQFRISALGGHFSGSGDGIVIGIPDLPPGVPALSEFKTHSEKSFRALVDDGVREAKPEHYVQMQEYMHHMGLMYAVYVAVNKDTDELHAEIVMYDRPVAEAFLERAKQILFNCEPPPRLPGATPAYQQCKYLCDFSDVCYSTVKPDRNCRTCDHLRFFEDGRTVCLLKEIFPATQGQSLSKEEQLRGCEHYRLNPKL